MKIHAVIPCFNEERYIGGLLDDLSMQTHQPDSVIIGDCKSEDKTLESISARKGNLSLQVVESPHRSPAAARNTAVGALACNDDDYLAFIDADMRLPSSFFEELQHVIHEHPADFISPRFVSDGKHFVDSWSLLNMNAFIGHTINRRHKVAGIGGVMIVRKCAHDKTGGFPQDVIADDLAYARRLNEIGATAHYAKHLKAINSSRRLRQDGVFKWLADMRPERQNGKKRTRKYGHYE